MVLREGGGRYFLKKVHFWINIGRCRFEVQNAGNTRKTGTLGALTQVESTGVHGLRNRKSAGRFSRHSHVNNLIRKALESAHVPTILELQGVLRTDGKRPDGMKIFPWRMGKCMVWDFMCSDTFAPSHLDVSSNHFGKVAERAEQAKLTKYEQLERDFEIVPICVETMSPWDPNGLKFVHEVGKRISEESGEPTSTVFLMQAIGMAIQQGNAAGVLGTVCKGSTSGRDVLFVMLQSPFSFVCFEIH